MGELMRSFDWSRTPLGKVESWPHSLRTSVGTCLNSRFAILVSWGPDLVMLYNDAYRPMLGAKHPGALGQKARDCWPEIWDIIGPMFGDVLAGGEATWSDDLLLLLERNGYPEECYFTFSFSPIRDESGGIAGVFTPVHETTARVLGARRIETLERLASRTAPVKNIQDACRAAVEAMAWNHRDLPFTSIYLVDESRAFATRVASTGAKITPQTVRFDLPELTPLAAAAQTGRIEVVRKSEDGYSPILVVPIPHGPQATPAGFLVTGENPNKRLDADYESFLQLAAGQVGNAIAEARALEDERKRAEVLAELDRAKTAFFSNVSHEFRTPLTLLLGPLEEVLAQPAPAVSPDVRERLQVVHRNGLRLLNLVNSLLDFSRIEAGRLRAVFEPLDISAYTAELAGNFRSAMDRAGLKFVVDCPPLTEPVYVDREMWEKIVLNLLSNAFKFTFHGSVRVTMRQTGGMAELEVADTGTGIPPDELPKVFERFHRVESTRGRTHEGTGIGLALVEELVKLQGGSVHVESEVGKGSRFVVTIPLGTGHLPEDRLDRAQTGASPPSRMAGVHEEVLRWLPAGPGSAPALVVPKGAEYPPPRIVLADDNADMRNYVARLLSETYDVRMAANGEEALGLIRADPPDLVLADIMMPVLDGIGLLKAVRGTSSARRIPVILLSARAGEEAEIEGLEAGADDYLIKPFSARELLARVRAHVEMARSRTETEDRYIRVLESITDGFVMMDRDWRITYVNAEAARINRKKPEEMIGKTQWEQWPASVGTEIERQFRRAMEQGAPVHFQHFYPAGYDLWLDIHAYPSKEGLALYFRDITLQKQAEQALEVSEAKFRKTFSRAAIGMALLDLEGRFLEVNETFCEITGYSESELKELDTEKISHAEDIPRKRRLLQAMMSGKIPSFVIEKRYLTKQGGTVWVRNSVSLLRDPYDRPSHIVSITEDVTERRLAEQALRESEERFRSMADSAPVLIWMAGADRLFSWFNKPWLEFTGRPGDAELGNGWMEGLHPDDRERFTALYKQSFDAHKSFQLEVRLRRYDGAWRWILDSGIPRYTPAGDFIGFIGSALDITDRREAEENLRTSESRYRNLAEALPQLVWTCMPDGLCDYLSSQWVDFTGVPEREQLGLNWMDRVLHPEDRDRTYQAWMEAVQDRAPYDIEYRLKRHDGVYRWFKVRGTPIRDDRGNIVKWFGTCTDVDEQRQDAEALRKANEELRRANSDLEQFAYSSSHDLQEPLRTLAVYSQLVQRRVRGKVDAETDMFLGFAITAAHRMENLLKDLLAYTQASRIQLAPGVQVSSQAVLEDVLSSLKTAVEESGAVIRSGPLPEVKAAEIHVQQLFQNLIGNALKYRAEAPPEIQVSAERQGGEWMFRIADNGIGIDPQYHKQIFGVFRRLHNADSYPGTGIGLAICQKIVEGYGGRIWVESAPGQGSTFCFLLPAPEGELS